MVLGCGAVGRVTAGQIRRRIAAVIGGSGARPANTRKSSIRLAVSHPRGSVADMRRLGKILIVVLASLTAATTTYYGTRIALNIWIDLGSTTFAEADVPKLVAMFAERETFLDDLDARTDERDRALSERDEAWRWRDAMQARINIR